jgi:hypothetical protein
MEDDAPAAAVPRSMSSSGGGGGGGGGGAELSLHVAGWGAGDVNLRLRETLGPLEVLTSLRLIVDFRTSFDAVF